MDTVSVCVAPARSGGSAADARRDARAFLDGLLPPVTSEAAGTVLLVVSELVTNALRHAGGTWSLELTAHPDGIAPPRSPPGRPAARGSARSSPGSATVGPLGVAETRAGNRHARACAPLACPRGRPPDDQPCLRGP